MKIITSSLIADFKYLVPRTIILLAVGLALGSITYPLDRLLSNPVVFFAILAQTAYYYFTKWKRSVTRLKLGWTVRGNDTI